MVLISFINRTFGLEFSGFFSMIMAILGQVYIFFNFRLKYFIATEHTNNIDFIDFFLFRFITSSTIFLLSLIGFVLIKEKFYYDLFYVENLSFFLDLKIFILTIYHILFRIGINADDLNTMPEFKGNK